MGDLDVEAIVGPAFVGFGQTIATLERNISQHCWAYMLHGFGYPVATCCYMLGIE